MANDNLSVMAEHYGSIGWSIMPTHGLFQTGLCTCGERHSDPKDIGKHPATTGGLNDATTNGATIHGWWANQPLYNVAVNCAKTGVFVLDVDPRNGGVDSFLKLEAEISGEFFAEGFTKTVTATTGEYTLNGQPIRGTHMYILAPEGVALSGKLKDFPGIDIKHKGYTLVAPSRHVSGVLYGWAPGLAPWETVMAKPSQVLLDLLSKNTAPSSGGSGGIGRTNWDWLGEKINLERFFSEGIDEGSRVTDIYTIACAMANKYGTSDMDRSFIETQLLRFNHEMVRPPLELEGTDGILRHIHNAIDFVAANPKDKNMQGMGGFSETVQRDVMGWARGTVEVKNTMTRTQSADEKNEPYTRDDDDATGEDTNSVPLDVSIAMDVDALSEDDGGTVGERTLSDLGNGRRFVDAFGNIMRYTPGLGWFKWNGQYWKPDTEDLEVRELAKKLGSLISAEAAHYEDSDARKVVQAWAKNTKSNARQAAAVESSQSDPRVGVDVDHWDNNPHLLGVANGVIDLRTGDLLQGRPDLHITRRSPIRYSPGFSTPRFQEFLDFATQGDKEYQNWLKRAFGYTLTGRRDYDVLFIVYGPAGSGKNVFVESLVKLLGTKQYAFPLDSQILAQGDGRANAADLYHWAELRGRRMIWVDELPESERLKENAVKKLTGSSEISARSPGEKPFTFESQGKLWITTNHRPVITDDAMWRRIRPIPWINVPEVADPTLKAYLHDPEGGLPAILAWAVEGAMELYASREIDALGWCTAVTDAAEVYRKNEDRLGLFLEDETEDDVSSSLKMRDLYEIYKVWSEDRTERPMSRIALDRKLADRGLQISGSGGSAVVLSKRLKTPGAPAPTHTPGTTDWGLAARISRDV